MYNVLLLDDETWALEDLKKIIEWEKYGFRVVGQAKNTIEAEYILKNKKVDFLISDIMLKGEDGLEFVNKIRSKYQLLIVFVSAYGKFEFAQKAVNLGAFDYLLKPVEKNKMVSLLKRVKHQLDFEKQNDEKIINYEKSNKPIFFE